MTQTTPEKIERVVIKPLEDVVVEKKIVVEKPLNHDLKPPPVAKSHDLKPAPVTKSKDMKPAPVTKLHDMKPAPVAKVIPRKHVQKESEKFS